MTGSHPKFSRRALWFKNRLDECAYPNASSLMREFGCARSTAQRTIDRLRDEYSMPVAWNDERRGYYLVNSDYALPYELPPGKDELAALLLATDVIKTIGDDELQEALAQFWERCVSSNPKIRSALLPLSQVFSSSSTAVADISDAGVLTFLEAASMGADLRIRYRSPWKHDVARVYEGRILRVHYSDGTLYLLFLEVTGRQITINASFVEDLVVLEEPLIYSEPDGDNAGCTENWLDGFGIWSGAAMESLVVEILPPASRYYASQHWHGDQQDSWDGEVLRRSIPGIVSPEIVRRVLSLGKWVKWVEPEELRRQVLENADKLVERLA